MKDKVIIDIVESELLFSEGFNCAQAVFAPFAKTYGINENIATKLCTSLFGGIGNRGETCGAIMGAFLVLGLKFGSGEPNTIELKNKIAREMQLIEDQVVGRYGSIKCNEMLGVDMQNKDARIAAAKSGVFAAKCPSIVKYTAKLLKELES